MILSRRHFLFGTAAAIAGAAVMPAGRLMQHILFPQFQVREIHGFNVFCDVFPEDADAMLYFEAAINGRPLFAASANARAPFTWEPHPYYPFVFKSEHHMTLRLDGPPGQVMVYGKDDGVHFWECYGFPGGELRSRQLLEV
jgi:hypothetical protein